MAEKWNAKEKIFIITEHRNFGCCCGKGQRICNKDEHYLSWEGCFLLTVGDETQLTDVFDKVVKSFGRVDENINNAGIMVDSSTVWRKACDVNRQGLVSLTLKGMKHMRRDEGGAGGTIINVSSTGAFARLPFISIYCGSKAAVLHFSQSIAIDPFHPATGVPATDILSCCHSNDSARKCGRKDM